MENKKYIGIIKWFDKEKSYGVISTNHDFSVLFEQNGLSATNSNEVFLHIKNWCDKIAIDITYNVTLVFNVSIEKNKLTAKNCCYFSNNINNWLALINYLGKNEIIKIYERHSSKQINLIEYSTNCSLFNFEIEDNLTENIFEALRSSHFEFKLEDINTLLSIYKKNENKNIIGIIDPIISYLFIDSVQNEKFELWRRYNLSCDLFSLNEYLQNNELLKISDLVRLKENGKTDIVESILLEKVEQLSQNYNHSEFVLFDSYLILISNESIKLKLIHILNLIGKQYYIKTFIDLLTNNVGKITKEWDFEQIENSVNEIPQFLSDSLDLKSALEYYFIENSDVNYLVAACLKGYFVDNESVLLRNIREFSNVNISDIIYTGKNISISFKQIIVESLLYDKSKFSLALRLANYLKNNEFFSKIDKLVFDKSQPEEYIDLWQEQMGKILPLVYLSDYFDENSSKYEKLKYWISNKIISQSELNAILFKKLDSINSIDDRKLFYTVFNIIKSLCKIESTNIDIIRNSNNFFYSLILWHLDLTDNFDFDFLKGKFIYFNPDEQVIILKKLFYLKSIGKIDFTIEQLNEIVRADVDLYLNNENLNPDISLDISTDIIITALLKFKLTGEFLVASDLLSIALKDLGSDKTKRFQLSSYFDKCSGRMIADFKPVKYNQFNSDNHIFKTKDNFIIRFSCDNYIEHSNGYKEYLPNDDFEELKNAVKLLPNRRWNPENRCWIVPSIYEKEVKEFGVANNFFFNLTDNIFNDNSHLIRFFRSDIPNGKSFCDGIIAQNLSSLTNKKFWWCSGSECFENVEYIHSSNDWKKYTLLDFLNILGLSVYENSSYGAFDIGLYNRFISQINRFNQLLERIYCRKCNQILYPVEIGNYAAYSVVRFKCVNDNCNEKNVIYLNHCLNPKCNAIIDSRDSKKCPNGLYVCANCGSCCSHKMFSFRLDTLMKTGGLLHDEETKVKNKEGHLERAEYFCHQCGKAMQEEKPDVFVCDTCNVKYDTVAYKIDRPFRYLKQRTVQSNNSDEIIDPF